MLTGIHHVAIIVSDMARAKRFYQDILGLTLIAETWRAERRSWKTDLALPDGSQIELFTFPDAPPRPDFPEAQGLRHLAFATPDLDATRARLVERRVPCEDIRLDSLTGRRFFFCSDPDTLPIEFYEG